MNAIAPTTTQRDDCLLRPGNTNCGGCGMSIGLTMLDRALAEAGQTCSLVIPACCGSMTTESPGSISARPTRSMAW